MNSASISNKGKDTFNANLKKDQLSVVAVGSKVFQGVHSRTKMDERLVHVAASSVLYALVQLLLHVIRSSDPPFSRISDIVLHACVRVDLQLFRSDRAAKAPVNL